MEFPFISSSSKSGASSPGVMRLGFMGCSVCEGSLHLLLQFVFVVQHERSSLFYHQLGTIIARLCIFSGVGPRGVSAQTTNPMLIKISTTTSPGRMRFIIFIKVILPFSKFGRTCPQSVSRSMCFAGLGDMNIAPRPHFVVDKTLHERIYIPNCASSIFLEPSQMLSALGIR